MWAGNMAQQGKLMLYKYEEEGLGPQIHQVLGACNLSTREAEMQSSGQAD